MAQFMNTSYGRRRPGSDHPSVLYYVGLFAQVDSYAARHKLKGIPRAELPRFIWMPSRRAGTTFSSS